MDSLDPVLNVTMPAFACSAVAFVFIGYLYTKIMSYPIGKDIGVPAIDSLSAQIRSGASSFLATEYKYLSFFVIALACTLYFLFYTTTPRIPSLPPPPSPPPSWAAPSCRPRRAGGG
jgi:Na+/H+-translocating membrane pyrophosphatase